MKIGLTYSEALNMPLGSLSDLIAIEKITNEGYRIKKSEAQEENEFFSLLAWR